MALSFITRKPDSGLGNIRASASAPSRNIDWVLLMCQAALSVAGLFVIYSASSTKFANPFLFVTRQEIFLIVAVLTMITVMWFDYDWWKDQAAFLYGATLMLLVMVIVAGTVSGGARLSFDLGPVKVQPAEFAKFTVLLFLAAYLAEEREDRVSYSRFITGLLIVGAPAALVIIQPDLGSASVLIAMAMGVLLIAGAKMKYIALITVLSAATVGAAVISGIVNEYQLKRITVFFDQNSKDPALKDLIFQGNNSIKAIATGGIWGKGWLEGPITRAKNDIPVQWADFPFSAVGEQFGLVGCAVLIGLYAIILMRIWRIAHLSRDLLGTYLCAGVFTMLLWQAFQNMAMAIGIMPITGLPLPFVSYGGSGVVTFFAMMGLVQSVHMRRYR
jgi:rod shape determining protein RodA